jgi:hypothetical protein
MEFEQGRDFGDENDAKPKKVITFVCIHMPEDDEPHCEHWGWNDYGWECEDEK